MAGDPAWYASVKLLLPMTGSHNGTAFADQARVAKTATASGAVKTVTDQSDPFGASGGVALFAASGELAVASHGDFAIGTQDFTLEFWFRPAAPLVGQNLFDLRPVGVNGAYPAFFADAAGGMTYYVSSADRITAPAGSLAANSWQHIALARVSGNSRLFVDGVQRGATWADATAYLQSGIRIGATAKGHMAQARLSVGVGRYAAGFTPPAAPFAAYNSQLTGSVTESLAAAQFVAEAHQAVDGALAGRTVFTGSSFIVDIKTAETAHYLTVKPDIGSVWRANTAYAPDAPAFATDPIATPYSYAVTAAGTSGGSEPAWPTVPGQTVVDGTVTWQCVERLVQPVTHGPLIAS